MDNSPKSDKFEHKKNMTALSVFLFNFEARMVQGPVPECISIIWPKSCMMGRRWGSESLVSDDTENFMSWLAGMR